MLPHRTDDTFPVRRAALTLRDFAVEARFTNPYDRAAHRWDYGLVFRSVATGREYQLVVLSDGTWLLLLAPDDCPGCPAQAVARGRVEGLDVSPAGANLLRLTASGPTGAFYVNGQFVADLDLGANQAAGDVLIATGMARDDSVAGKATPFADFAVWAVGGR